MKYLLINILMLMTASENILRLSRNIENEESQQRGILYFFNDILNMMF